jgi:hypothetical protein
VRGQLKSDGFSTAASTNSPFSTRKMWTSAFLLSPFSSNAIAELAVGLLRILQRLQHQARRVVLEQAVARRAAIVGLVRVEERLGGVVGDAGAAGQDCLLRGLAALEEVGIVQTVTAGDDDLQTDLASLLAQQRRVRRVAAEVDHLRRLRQRSQHGPEVLVTGLDGSLLDDLQTLGRRGLRELLDESHAVGRLVVDRADLREVGLVGEEGGDRGAHVVVPRTHAEDVVEAALGQLGVRAERRDLGEAAPLVDVARRDADAAVVVPHDSHDGRVVAELLRHRLAALGVALVVALDDLDLLAVEAALLVELLHRDLDGVERLLTGTCVLPGQRSTHRDRDLVRPLARVRGARTGGRGRGEQGDGRA